MFRSFLIIFIVILFTLSLISNDDTPTKCYTIDRSIELWHKLDTSSVGGINNTKNLININIYPNPSRENIIIDLINLVITPNELSIIDINGNNIYDFPKNYSENIKLEWNLKDKNGKKIPNGTYFLNIQNKRNNSSYKFIIN